MSQVKELIRVLKDTRVRLEESIESVYSHHTPAEMIDLIDRNLDQIKIDSTYDKEELDLLYAPTASLQDTAIDNGWGEDFLKLASRYDEATKN